VLRIIQNHGSAGFWAYALFALDQLLFAERNDLIPYIYFGKCAVNGHDHGASGQLNRYYDKRFGENMWTYFFDQIKSPYTPGAKGFTVHQIQSSALWVLVNDYPQSVFCHYTGMHKNKGDAYDESFFKAQREKGYRLVQKYFRVKRSIRTKVDEIWRRENIEKCNSRTGMCKVLGVHIRGTDKQEVGAKRTEKKAGSLFLSNVLPDGPTFNRMYSNPCPHPPLGDCRHESIVGSVHAANAEISRAA
jgi:hypothetical protein